VAWASDIVFQLMVISLCVTEVFVGRWLFLKIAICTLRCHGNAVEIVFMTVCIYYLDFPVIFYKLFSSE
jgi:hypothetical protein